MNDMIQVFFEYNVDNLQERIGLEREIRYLDKLVELHGWKYSGVANIYFPVVAETREETVGKVIEAIRADERLKKYSPKVLSGTTTNACKLEEIKVQHMEVPGDDKYHRYEKYYLETKECPHAIVVDEMKKIRDGYVSYLLAKKYGCRVDVIEVPKESAVSKLVIGTHMVYNKEQQVYIAKTSKRYAWIYDLKDAVVMGDILLVQARKGYAYMQVEEITYIAGRDEISKRKKVIRNITAANDTK